MTSVSLPRRYRTVGFDKGQFGFIAKRGPVRFDDLVIAEQNLYPADYPTVGGVPLSGTLANGTDVPLCRFTVSAPASTDIGFYKSSFEVSTTSPDSLFGMTGFKLVEDPNFFATDLTFDGPRACDESVDADTCVANILIDTDSNGTDEGGEYRIVSAGTTQIYELRGTVFGASTGSVIETTLRPDIAMDYTDPQPAWVIDAGVHDEFIWSDLHLGFSSNTASTSAEWFNGFSVPGLVGAATQVLTK